jgi:hypothetical protein
VALLGAYGYPCGQAAVTQSNLLALDDKITAIAGGSTSNDTHARSGLESPPARLAPLQGRHKYDTCTWEIMAHRIQGTDLDADISSLFLTKLSVVRCYLANVSVPLKHLITNRASSLSTAFQHYTARSIIHSGVCELRTPA